MLKVEPLTLTDSVIILLPLPLEIPTSLQLTVLYVTVM
jgi:hypothetical protein